jgi:putative endonuclease
LDLFDCFRLESLFDCDPELNSDQLGVGKVGLPPLFFLRNNLMSSSAVDISTQTTGHLAVGKRGEELAAAYLEQIGLRIVAANFVIPVGRSRLGALISAEIDLVAYDGETLCFIEVKSRMSDWFAPPEANVDRRKQRQIVRAARNYRRMFDLTKAPYRYDVVTVVLSAEGKQGADVQLLRNYWQEDRFRKRGWSNNYWD